MSAAPTRAVLDKEYYLDLLKEKGLSHTLTELHHEMADIEFECFEGKNGYQPDLYQDLQTFRDFSRELWTLAHEPDVKS